MVRSGLRRAAAVLLCVALCGLHGPALAGAAGDTVVDADTAALIDAARQRLPPALAARLDDGLRIEWRDDLGPHVDGHYRAGVVALRASLLDGWRRRAGDDPTDANARPAVAALVHEIAHAWDRSPAGGASHDPRLLDLAGWSVTPLRGRLRRNPYRDRSPDAYELDSPAEFVAVNLEHFVLDTDYACRRPALAEYFAARTGAATPGACGSPAFARASVAGAADASTVLALDPSRVYAVDYLLAEPDAHPMSRWGHAMLRLVVCAPGRAPGPDCRLDIAWHEVLSFRAFVDDVQVSSWRGLTGGYPSRLFVLPMPQVVEDYTKVELRTLRSVPLRLSRGEIASLLARAAQVHWSYDGHYRFVDNNCAVETWRLLHDGVPRLADARLASLSPTALLSRLEREGIADGTVLADADSARRNGYRFDSIAEHLQGMLDAARESLPIPQARVEPWLDLAPAARAAWIERANLRATAALLVLENAALRRAQLRAMDALKRRLGRERGTPIDDALHDTLAVAARFSRPAALLPAGGYGLPDRAEREVASRQLTAAAAEWDAGTATLQRLGEAALPPRSRRALEDTRRNVDRLGARLRGQARGAQVPAT